MLTLIDRPITTGGGERMASVIASRLDPARFDRFLCSSRSTEAATFESELVAAGVRVLVLRRRSKIDLVAWRPLVRLLRHERIDVLHAHKFGSNVWGTLLGRIAHVPVVVAHEHSWSYEGNPLRRFLDREIVGRGANAFVAVSREDQRRMIEIEGVRPEVVRFVPNGIPDPVRLGHDVRAELGIDASAPVVGTVGQLRPEKALGVLVDAAAILVRDFPSLRVLIVGHGPEHETLGEAVRSAGLNDTVLFAGRRDDIPDVLAAVDVAVCCSDSEGSPLSVMEYMAAGRPVVATRVGGIPDLIEDGVTGVLVPVRDPPALASALHGMLVDRKRRLELGRRAEASQRAEFRLDVLVRRMESLYEELYRASARGVREGWRGLDG